MPLDGNIYALKCLIAHHHSQKCLLCNVYRKPGESVDEMMHF